MPNDIDNPILAPTLPPIAPISPTVEESEKEDVCEALLGRGYFPKELPPPFNTRSLAKHSRALIREWNTAHSTLPKKNRRPHPRPSYPVLFDMARKGHARRMLAVPNPVNQTYLCERIGTHWSSIGELINKSSLSVTKCELSSSGRAIPLPPLSQLAEMRIVLYATRGAVLQTDILSFYHSIYSHSIPWALHGKPVAKSERDNPTLFGNRIDSLLRSCQDGQTIGLPVGPDTSRIISEFLLCAVEASIPDSIRNRIVGGFRYVDDFFLCFDSLADAEIGLAGLREACLHFDLRLNPAKTHTIDALSFNEETWATEIAAMRIATRTKEQRHTLMRFFSNVIRLAKALPDESIASFAIRKTAKTLVNESNWDIYEAFILRIARENSNCIDAVVKIICTYAAIGYKISASVSSFIERMIADHAPYDHHYEVAWSLWLALSLKIRISATSSSHVMRMENDICALLALHLETKRLTSRKRNKWIGSIGADDLYGNHWLLIYESTQHKGWKLDGADETVSNNPFFKAMKDLKVSFFDPRTRNRPIKIPGIDWHFRRALGDRRRILLPGLIEATKTEFGDDDQQYEELGGDYGDADMDYPWSHHDYEDDDSGDF